MAQQMFTKIGQQMFLKIGQQMFLKIDQQMLTKIGQQMFHTIKTDGRQAGANQQMFLTYTIDGRRPFVTPDRFFCLFFKTPLYHYCGLSSASTCHTRRDKTTLFTINLCKKPMHLCKKFE